FIAEPKTYLPGTKMSYGGLKNPAPRADLIAYLRTLSDNPAPLPEPAAQSAAPEGDTPPASPPAPAPAPATEQPQAP
ncbi:MAG: cytochrome c family protein, partial [Pseudomonadota bacterium]|nr:cytochrome c family protein [Pseudomonadota bacterium]